MDGQVGHAYQCRLKRTYAYNLQTSDDYIVFRINLLHATKPTWYTQFL